MKRFKLTVALVLLAAMVLPPTTGAVTLTSGQSQLIVSVRNDADGDRIIDSGEGLFINKVYLTAPDATRYTRSTKPSAFSFVTKAKGSWPVGPDLANNQFWSGSKIDGKYYAPGTKVKLKGARDTHRVELLVQTLPAGQVSVFCFEDVNGDEKWNEGEHGLAGVQCVLYNEDFKFHSVSRSSESTTSDGLAGFSNVPAGSYALVLATPIKWVGEGGLRRKAVNVEAMRNGRLDIAFKPRQ